MFRVVWGEQAVEQLTTIWLSARDRDRVTSAVKSLDRVLAADPLGPLTQDLAEGLRGATAPPVRVIFVVTTATKVVEIAAVRAVTS